MSIADFESKILIVLNLTKACEDIRILIMQKACRFDNFKKLNIPQEFLSFLSNSSYLFRFFEELAVEQKSCLDLQNADVYAEFSEHLDILNTLLEKYTTLLTQKGYYDAITLPNLYEINYDYLARFDRICLYLDGFLNSFEFNLFKQISQTKQVDIILSTNIYNTKMKKLFNIKEDKKIKFNLNLNSYEILGDNEICHDISYKSFSLRSLQIPYVFTKIQEFVDEGIEPQNIAIVLPDESFVPLLKAFDSSNNLNFAMGFSIKQSKEYVMLQVLSQALSQNDELSHELISYHKLTNHLEGFLKIKDKSVNFEEFKSFLDSFEFEFSSQMQLIFEQELYNLKLILNQIKLSFYQAYKLFLQRLSKKSLDDVRGGKITTLGILETRGLEYEGLIIIDFNDEFVPKFSQKDMFLSSKIRSFANLPSLKDREDLQRYFYTQIINKAKKVAISCVQNETSIPSRFLQSFKVNHDDYFDESSYYSVLFMPHESKSRFICEHLVRQNTLFDSPISASRLKHFLSCKMGYYFKYILHIEDEDIPSDDLSTNDVGIFLHDSLKELYESHDGFDDAKTLHKKLCDILDEKEHKKSLWHLQKEVWKRKLVGFCNGEIKRFAQGWKPYKLENIMYHEAFGVQIYGKIDRIDINDKGELCVLDYKSGKIPNEKLENKIDFQLQFYYLLAQKLGKVIKVGYYDLNTGEIFYEQNLEETLKLLEQIFADLKSQKSIDYADGKEQKCAYSPYHILLGKDDG